MAGIVEWAKNYSMVFLLMTILSTVAARKEYRKYIQLFVEIILVITLLNPLLGLFGKSSDLFEKISYGAFWQGLANIKLDQEKMEFFNEGHYVAYYEKAIAEDVKLLADNSGYAVTDVFVSLNEAFEVESMEIEVAKQNIETVIVGTLEENAENTEIKALKEKIAAYYRIGGDCITIRN
ncbi:MAG: stage III sporulation protein AF [Eubacterium sp.]|jgi:hypothetical protein|nr:stage III sporulation protein AF [Eubacterium sp.]